VEPVQHDVPETTILTPRPASDTLDAQARAAPSIEGYEILGILGRGGMGVVYRARQKSLGRIVALKVLVGGAHADADLIARFQAEAEAVARLHHPHIVQVYEVGQTDGFPYFTLEYVPGGSLAERLAGQPIAPREAAERTRELALAIHAAHQAGIIHRDLKPANVLIAADGSPRVADFGLAKYLDASDQRTRTGEIMGTPSYMAPEQAGGITRSIGPACDTYALGAILYEMLTGGPPFRGHDPMETVLAVLSQDPVSVRRLTPRVPRDLETICHKCLEKTPKKRYATAQALAEDLTRFLEGHPIVARPITRAEKLWKWAHRRPALAGLIAVSLLATILLISYGTWKNRQLSAALLSTQEARVRAEENVRKAIESAARRITYVGDRSDQPLQSELAFFEAIRQQTGNDVAANHERALAAGWAGYIYSELNDFPASKQAFQQSIEGFQKLCEEFPKQIQYRQELANFIGRHGSALIRQGDDTAAAAEFKRSIEILDQLHAQDPQAVEYRLLLAAHNNNLAQILARSDGDALPIYNRALQLRRDLLKEFPGREEVRFDIAVTQSNLGTYYSRKAQYDQAEKTLRECLMEMAGFSDELRSQVEYRRTLASANMNLGNVLAQQKKYAEADKLYSEGVREIEQIVAALPESVPSRLMLIDALRNLATLRIQQDQLAEAIAPFERMVAVLQKLVKEFPDREDFRNNLKQRTETLERIKRVVNFKPAALDESPASTPPGK